MADFTSARYLGQTPASFSIPPTLRVTTGKPAALHEPAGHQAVARRVAQRQGLEGGVLCPSSLHAFWDLFGTLPKNRVVLVNEDTYPIGQWGAARALLKGMPVVTFPAQDGERLSYLLHHYHQRGQTPWLLTDGWWAAGGQPAPLARFYHLLQPYGGTLLVDDTQAFGILGERPDAHLPYGYGGGGSLPFAGFTGPQLVTVTSLSKGLGVPVTVLAGNRAWLAQYKRKSETRVHTSPVSNLHAWAAESALRADETEGDVRRKQLYDNVQRFRQTLSDASVPLAAGSFPVQKLPLRDCSTAFGLYAALKEKGIHSLLLSNPGRPGIPEVALCLRADHTPEEIARTGHYIRQLLKKSIIHNAFNPSLS